AVVRPERGVRPALPLPRLEIRRERPVRGPALGARGIGNAPGDQAEVLPNDRAGRRGVDLHGAAGAQARAARARMGEGVCRSALRFQAPAGVQLPPGDRRGDRFEPRVLPAFGRARDRSAFQGQQGQPVQPRGPHAGLRSRGFRGRPSHRRAAQGGARQILLAHHALDHALAHDHSPAGGASSRSARLGADRRRALLGLEHQLSPRPGVERIGIESDERRRRDPCEIRSRHLCSAREQVERLSDRPHDAEARPLLQRRRGHCDAGRVAAGIHGPDPGPHQGAPVHDRQGDRRNAKPPVSGGQSCARRQERAGTRRGVAAGALLRDRAAGRTALQGRREARPLPGARHRSGDGLERKIPLPIEEGCPRSGRGGGLKPSNHPGAPRHPSFARRGRLTMSRLRLSLACWDYDRTRALADGSVRPEGIDLIYHKLLVEETFFRMLRNREFDAAEMSLSSYCVSLMRDDPAFIAIPVFPSRFFRHSCIFVSSKSGIGEPRELAGKRIGVPEYQMTAPVWIRGILQDEYGVEPAGCEYWTGGEEDPGRDEKLKLDLPAKFRLQPIGPKQTLAQMIAEGEIDALHTARAPSTFATRPDAVKRLFENYVEIEKAYYRKTGIFPIMHTVVIRRELYGANRWIAQSLYKAFVQAQQRTY